MNTNIDHENINETKDLGNSQKKKRKLLQILAISLGSLLLILLLVFGYFYYFIHTPRDKKAQTISFTVIKGEGIRAISQNLESKGLIRQDIPFMIYLKVAGLSGTIQAGVYRISPAMSPMELADILSNGKVASKTITIPEGWTIDQIGTYLEKQGVVKKVDFISATKQQYDYPFLADKPKDADVQGYLFPDTYQISVTADSEKIVKTMLDNFGNKLTDDTRAAIAKSGLNIYETVTLASIVEREVAKPEQRKIVAGIFLNRLSQSMKLQSDATVAFALGTTIKRFTLDDIAVNSPYNTYVVSGLPKGPIGNPGLDSILAVVYPENSDYLFFITSGDTAYYSKTLAEHEAKVQQYLK